MSTYTDSLNKLLKEGFSYDSPEVKALQRISTRSNGNVPVVHPTRVMGNQDDRSQLEYHRKRLGEHLTDAEVIDLVNKEFNLSD